MTTATTRGSFARQRGFSLIELSIAILIGLFLVGALLTVVQNNKRAFIGQNQLAQMQDSERLALSMMGDVIQRAGYYPDPITNTDASALTATGSFAAAQAIVGSGSSSDRISARYMTALNDQILNCSGKSNTTIAQQLYVNEFWVDTTTSQLKCTLTGGPDAGDYVLVNGVTKLTMQYGVKTDMSLDNNTPDSYFTTAQMVATPARWSNVITARVTLTFTNPLYTSTNGQPATINAQRVINVMSRAGVRL